MSSLSALFMEDSFIIIWHCYHGYPVLVISYNIREKAPEAKLTVQRDHQRSVTFDFKQLASGYMITLMEILIQQDFWRELCLIVLFRERFTMMSPSTFHQFDFIIQQLQQTLTFCVQFFLSIYTSTRHWPVVAIIVHPFVTTKLSPELRDIYNHGFDTQVPMCRHSAI